MSETRVEVPDIGDASDVDVVEVLVKPGATVNVDQGLVVLESEKASMEVPSPLAGVVKEVKIKVGDKVSQGSLILVLESDGVAAKGKGNGKGATQAKPEPSLSPKPEEPRRRQKKSPRKPRRTRGRKSPRTKRSRARPARESAAAPAPRAAPQKPVGPTRTVPPPSAPIPSLEPPAPTETQTPRLAFGAAPRRASSASISSHVPGTGPHGRITKEDVQRYVKHAMSVAGTATGTGFAVPELPEIDFNQFGETSIQPLTKIQKLSGRNLHRSWVTIPHVTQFDDADITELEDFRKKMRADRPETKLTLTAFFMKAIVVVLKHMPRFNSSLDRSGENLIMKHYFHVGVAVDTPNGLVVPVIRDVDTKGLHDLAVELSEVSERARARRLSPQDLQGASITVSSLGGIGGTYFTPIINPPEVAVLGVSRAHRAADLQRRQARAAAHLRPVAVVRSPGHRRRLCGALHDAPARSAVGYPRNAAVDRVRARTRALARGGGLCCNRRAHGPRRVHRVKEDALRAASWCLLASFCCSTVVDVASAQTPAPTPAPQPAPAQPAPVQPAPVQPAPVQPAPAPGPSALPPPTTPAPAPAPEAVTPPPPPPPNFPGTTDAPPPQRYEPLGTPEPEIEKGDWDPWEHPTVDHHRHNGFFLRLAIGPSYGSVSGDDHIFRDVDDISLSGFGLAASITIGGALIDNLILNADLFQTTLFSPDVDVDGRGLGGAGELAEELGVGDDVNIVGIGLGVTYYFMPVNIYIGGTAGIGQVVFEDESGHREGTDVGFVGNADRRQGVVGRRRLGHRPRPPVPRRRLRRRDHRQRRRRSGQPALQRDVQLSAARAAGLTAEAAAERQTTRTRIPNLASSAPWRLHLHRLRASLLTARRRRGRLPGAGSPGGGCRRALRGASRWR